MTTIAAELVIGNIVKITTVLDDEVTGEVFSFEESTGVVILRKLIATDTHTHTQTQKYKHTYIRLHVFDILFCIFISLSVLLNTHTHTHTHIYIYDDNSGPSIMILNSQ